MWASRRGLCALQETLFVLFFPSRLDSRQSPPSPLLGPVCFPHPYGKVPHLDDRLPLSVPDLVAAATSAYITGPCFSSCLPALTMDPHRPLPSFCTVYFTDLVTRRACSARTYRRPPKRLPHLAASAM
ncbi:hypothetical protein DFH06DRAFT_576274 [Mycena polygramma]|nr:hypothetical protein DFH06DRAFT_576274 [Mycena polygramma]